MKHFQRGFTLIEIMIAVMVGSIVLVGIGTVMAQLGTNQSDAKLQLAIDAIQSSNVQYVRIMKNIRSLIYAEPTTPGYNINVIYCLQDQGNGVATGTNPACNGIAGPIPTTFTNVPIIAGLSQPPLNNFLGTNAGGVPAACPTGLSSTCRIQTITQYKATCSTAQRCESITFQIDTKIYNPPGSRQPFVSRSFTFVVPGYAIVSRGQVNFNCVSAPPFPGKNLVSGLDFTSALTGTCSPMTGYNGTAPANTALAPLATFGDVPGPDLEQLVGSTCPDGFFVFGLGFGQNTCNSPAVTGSPVGACGPASYTMPAVAPTTGLCSTGAASPTTLVGYNTWAWTCTAAGGAQSCTTKSPCTAPYDEGIFGVSTFGCSTWY